MLASVLPGLRDVRAPLAAGYVWLLAFYVAFEPLVRRKHRGIWATLSHLDHRLSALGLGIAVSFAAYLVGSLSQTLSQRILVSPQATGTRYDSHRIWPWTRISRMWRFRRRYGSGYALAPYLLANSLYGDAGRAALADMARSRVEGLSGALHNALDMPPDLPPDTGPLTAVVGTAKEAAIAMEPPTSTTAIPLIPPPKLPPRLSEALAPLGGFIVSLRARTKYAEAPREETLQGLAIQDLGTDITTEFRLARISLVGEQPDLFSEIDRLQSEAEFRAAVALPLVGLAIAMAWRATWWSAPILIVAAILLGLSARSQARKANDSLLEALRVGRAHVPSLDRFDDAISAVKNLGSPDENG